MILKLALLVLLKLECCYCLAKSGVAGIKIKPSIILGETTDYQELDAVIGSSVSLPCNLSPTLEDAVHLVLWYRLDLPNPIYTLDSRTASQQAKHYSSKVLGTRASLNVSRGGAAAHLKVDPVEEGDEGEYRCRIDYKRGRTLNRMVKLNVIVPVKKILIRGIGNITYSGMIGPFTEGDKLLLICEAIGGRPSPNVIWRKGPTFLQGTLSTCGNGIVRNELAFDRLRREDMLSLLVCQASNNNLTRPAQDSVTIDLNLKPLSIQMTSLPGVLKSGDTVELNCQSEGSRPPAAITWTKGTEVVNHFAIYNVYGSIAVSSLTVMLLPEDHGKKLTCTAQNPHLPESALRESIKLNVQFRPQLSLVLGVNARYEHIREGSDVYFECNIQSNPPASNLVWKFDSRILVHSPRNGVELKNNSLLLHNVGWRNIGKYQCQSENAVGKGVSEEVLLRIQHSPVCSSLQQKTYSIRRHESINITCEVDADPPELTFSWQTNNTGALLELEDPRTIEQGTTSLLEYRPLTETDHQLLFLCRARNAIGSMKQPCVFTVSHAGPPNPLRNCGVKNRTASTLHLSCDQDRTSARLSYHLEIFDMKGEELLANLTSNRDPTFQVSNLPAQSTFIAVLYSTSEGGKSDTVALTTSTLLSMERHTVVDTDTASLLTIVVLASLAVLSTLGVLAVVTGIIILKSKSTMEVGTMQTEMIEKLPNTTKHNYDDQNTYIYHTSEVPKDCLYSDLMGRQKTAFETGICKTHPITEEEFL